jgi:uncharacterized protein YndB with AHSA1/START domain
VSPERVFAAFTDGEQLSRWWGFKTEARRELHRDGRTQTLERLERFLVHQAV